MQRRLPILLVLLSFVLGAGTSLAEPKTGKELMRLVREKNDSESQVSQISMQLIDKKGRTQDRQLMIFAEQVGKSENTLTRFIEPKRVKGIGFLVVNDGGKPLRYLYTPADKKTRRVPEGDNKKSFQGTDFTYYDLSPHDVESDNYEALRAEKYDGHDCWVCTSLPQGENEIYSKVVQWIRKDIYLPVKMDFYDPDGKLLKTSIAEGLKQIDGYWTPTKTTMHNVQIDHKTVMKVDKVQYNKKLPENLFSKTSLEKGQ